MARQLCEALLRQDSQIVQANSAVQDADKIGLGLNIRKSRGTPVGPVDMVPVLY